VIKLSTKEYEREQHDIFVNRIQQIKRAQWIIVSNS